MTLTIEDDLDNVNVNHHAKCVGQRSFSSKIIVRIHRHTRSGPTALSGPLKWSVINNSDISLHELRSRDMEDSLWNGLEAK